ncbi:MAG: hypothetical protein ACJAYB_000595 [Psychromonas sp.]|jgi:hypothetical protein
MQLLPLNHRINGNYCERRCNIRRLNDNGIIKNKVELWFKFDKSISPPKDDDCDAYLLAMIMDAMKESENIEVKGSVSRQLLSNLVEYQAIWNKWLPNIYNKIDIRVNNIRDDIAKVQGAICAFSGGVDATFSVWRHSQSNYSYRSQKINLCSMVHGFDIPLSDESAFNNARNRAQKTLSDIGIGLKSIKTNYRVISGTNWEHSCSCALAATLSNFKKMAGTCIIGSSEPYDSLVIPWGSSPITDHLLSSNEFVVIHDGASHNRTEKVKEITKWKAGTDNLRVCWQGDLKDRNCGWCEKCVRTKMNYLAVQASVPICFPNSNIITDIKNVTLKSDLVLTEWRQIYEYATNNGIEEPWVKALSAIINKKFTIGGILPKRRTRRKIMKKLTRLLNWA